MIIIIFIIILLTLVMIHEAGHFFAAKISGVRVDEFAFGFPPKLFSKKFGETEYIFNALPIGGYVKIHGENGGDTDPKRSFVNKNPFVKIFILAAGVIMNIILAYVLIILATYLSHDIQVNNKDDNYKKFLSEGRIKSEQVFIAELLPNSPASQSVLKSGSEVLDLYLNEESNSGLVLSSKKINFFNEKRNVAEIISEALNGNKEQKIYQSITLVFKNKDLISTSTLAGVYGLSKEKKKVVGISFVETSKVKLTLLESLNIGIEKTNTYIYLTILGFKELFINIFLNGELSQNIAGPIGMVSMVKSVSDMGFNYLLTFAATLSISLAIFNIFPFPALDGGRIVFVLYEAITRRKISEKWQTILHGTGFSILIFLMLLVTVKDILKIFN